MPTLTLIVMNGWEAFAGVLIGWEFSVRGIFSATAIPTARYLSVTGYIARHEQFVVALRAVSQLSHGCHSQSRSRTVYRRNG